MKIFPALILLCASLNAAAVPFAFGNVQTGEKMFAQYKCNRCHINMVGGDGSGIFTRTNRRVNNESQLIAQIGVCGGNVDKEFSAQEKLDLAAYLNRYYQFK
ncbi:MAG: cytochrome c [Gallionella sp.]